MTVGVTGVNMVLLVVAWVVMIGLVYVGLNIGILAFVCFVPSTSNESFRVFVSDTFKPDNPFCETIYK